MPHIDRATDLLEAVWYGPTHARLGGAAVAWPLASRAQQQAMPVIGYLATGSPAANSPLLAAFHQGLSETGYVAGQNVTIEYRWAEFRYDRLPALAADLVGRKVDVIAAIAVPPIRAAKTATSVIPIVFMSGPDPVAAGWVASVAQPGGNLTGVSIMNTELNPKRLVAPCSLTVWRRVSNRALRCGPPACGRKGRRRHGWGDRPCMQQRFLLRLAGSPRRHLTRPQ